ncbi:MAG TPA: cob(I)yrinic acid a,c-diamide adenosyltransferase [Phycisphaerales bacterium]|nr:cob(I)yrinic acid a,c-diamide adenosyltransferase [Phycisphaerales bacterium]
MPRLTKIYTKTGDDGTTGLVGTTRVRKDDLRVEAYGTVDETNAAVGVAVSECERMIATDRTLFKGHHVNQHGDPATLAELAVLLRSIQHDLFDLGADLATPITADESDPQVAAMRLRIVPSQVTRLEQAIDQYNDPLPALTNFVLPGGNPAAAALHLARTICRRAERLVVTLSVPQTGAPAVQVNPQALIYLNRLSDLLFVLARVANNNGQSDVLWVPGKSR